MCPECSRGHPDTLSFIYILRDLHDGAKPSPPGGKSQVSSDSSACVVRTLCDPISSDQMGKSRFLPGASLKFRVILLYLWSGALVTRFQMTEWGEALSSRGRKAKVEASFFVWAPDPLSPDLK